MGYKPRYFYGKNQEVKLKLPGAMAEQLRRLSVEDRRPSLNREIVYLVGCKLEGIDNARKRRAEHQAHQSRLNELEKELGRLWKALIMTTRPKDIDPYLTELKALLIQAQVKREAVDRIPDYQESGEPEN